MNHSVSYPAVPQKMAFAVAVRFFSLNTVKFVKFIFHYSNKSEG